jgi:hypothetical protein
LIENDKFFSALRVRSFAPTTLHWPVVPTSR